MVAQVMSADGVRYQTIEQRRAALHMTMLAQPGDPRVRDHLLKLTTPRLIRQAAKDGVFISYSRADEIFALNLARGIRRGGVTPWMDMLDVESEEDWWGEVRAALNRCGLMLAIVSPDALTDAALQAERRTFMQQGKIVLPVLYKAEVRAESRAPELYLPPVDFRYNTTLGLQILLRLIAPTARQQATAEH